MAERLGKPYVVLSSWERGDRCPSAKDARKWADALDVPWPANADDWFSRRTGELQPCGTRAAFQRHVRKNEVVDQACREADNAYMRGYRRTGRKRQRMLAPGDRYAGRDSR